MSLTPQTRARRDLRDMGYVVESMETTQRNGFKRDGFGCFDLVALGHGLCLFIQVTSHAHSAGRMAKVQAFLDHKNGVDGRHIAPNMPENWHHAGNVAFEVWTYGPEKGERGATRRRWSLAPGKPPAAIPDRGEA